MKANAPEKIYFSSIEDGTHYYTEAIPFEREYIEYVRKDAFIEKASEWIKEQDEMVGISFTEDFIERFKNHMKGE
jgi:hypothetical protein